MIKCGWCGSETKMIYTLKDGKALCPICAEKHYNTITKKLENHIQEIHNGIKNRRKSLNKLKQEMCKHDFIDTEYCKVFAPMKAKEIYRCKNCGKEIYK